VYSQGPDEEDGMCEHPHVATITKEFVGWWTLIMR